MEWATDGLRLTLCLLLISSELGREASSFTATDPPPPPPDAEARGGESCNFPNRWSGNWFQSGVHQLISIHGHNISTKGRCLEADGEKYLLLYEREKCFRCVVFHEKHTNVLQYKETLCLRERRPLKSFCGMITGDASLHSLFRADLSPIDCPFRGPMTFTYNRGHGECRYPLSTIDTCIHPSRLIFNYQACPDIPGTESTAEELQCLATWKEGSSRYLLGLMQYRHHASYEERFRCFVYERSKKSSGGQGGQGSNSSDSNILYRIAQSGDATCNGLTPSEGSRTMTFRKAIAPKPCQFPSWLPKHPQWFTLNMRLTYTFEATSLRVGNYSSQDLRGLNSLVMSASCAQIIDNLTIDKVVLILHTTQECVSGYKCTVFYRRDGHIVEMQMGTMARRAEDACHVSYFNQTQLPYVTLISSTPETRQCPYLGRFEVTGVRRDGRDMDQLRSCSGMRSSSLLVGCNKLDTLLLRTDCRPDSLAEYACHGWWEEMGTSYLVTTPLSRASTAAPRYCFVFRESTQQRSQPSQLLLEDNSNNDSNNQKSRSKDKKKDSGGDYYRKTNRNSLGSLFSFTEPSDSDGEDPDGEEDLTSYVRILQFSSLADSCRRNILPGIDGTLAFNVSSTGDCSFTNTASFPRLMRSCLISLTISSFVVFTM